MNSYSKTFFKSASRGLLRAGATALNYGIPTVTGIVAGKNLHDAGADVVPSVLAGGGAAMLSRLLTPGLYRGARLAGSSALKPGATALEKMIGKDVAGRFIFRNSMLPAAGLSVSAMGAQGFGASPRINKILEDTQAGAQKIRTAGESIDAGAKALVQDIVGSPKLRASGQTDPSSLMGRIKETFSPEVSSTGKKIMEYWPHMLAAGTLGPLAYYGWKAIGEARNRKAEREERKKMTTLLERALARN